MVQESSPQRTIMVRLTQEEMYRVERVLAIMQSRVTRNVRVTMKAMVLDAVDALEARLQQEQEKELS